MRLKTGNYKTLTILGAGATRGAFSSTGSPRVYAPLNGDYFKILAKFVNTKEGKKCASAHARLIDFLEREVGQKGIDKLTMEHVFNVLFISKDLPQIFHKGRGRKRISGFRQEIRDFLSLLIRVFHFVQSNSKNSDRLQHHQILTNSLSPNDVIMTLNYDTIMDNALISGGWNPTQGYGFNAKVTFQLPRSTSLNPQLKNVLLLKPHGSFNWFAKGKIDNIESVLENRPVSEIIISKLPRLYEDSQRNLVRFFVPPLYTKFFKNKFWSKLWIKTYKETKSANRLIVVGCSLIATDYHLRAILSKAMSDKQTKYQEIILVDPSENVQKNLKFFFRGRSKTGCKVYPSFSNFCRRAFK